MASYLPSPFTTQVWGMSGYGLNRLPSIKRCCGCGFSCSIARCMARNEALRILMRSISSGVTIPMAHAMASCSIMGRNS